MSNRRWLLIYSLLAGLFVLPIVLSWLGGKYWLGWGYHNYLAPLLDQHNTPWHLWREQVGDATHPHFLNILYYWPFKLLSLIIPSNYGAWLVYVYLVFALSGLSFSLYVRRLLPQISYPASLFLGLFYTSYISINLDGELNSLKLAAMVLPFILWMVWGKQSVFRSPRSVASFLFTSLLILNLVLLAPRAVVALLILVLVHFAVLWWQGNGREVLLRVGGWLLTVFVGTAVLFWPFKLARDAYLSDSVQISVPVKQAVLTYLLKPTQFIFHPYPGLSIPPVVVALGVILVLGLLFFLVRNRSNGGLLVGLVVGLILTYFLFLWEPLLTFLTTRLPYGQLFRTWRVAQFLGAFILPLLLVPLFSGEFSLRKAKPSFVLGGLLVGLYLVLSVIGFNRNLNYVEQQDLQSYKEVNSFLAQDDGNHKVLWVPEMGWLNPQGEDTSPFWLEGETGQSFPEFISAQPTYAHYYNRLTNFYTWLASGYWDSWLQKSREVGQFLNILGVKYLIVHDDVPAYQGRVEKMLSNLTQSSDLEKVFENGALTVYRNKEYRSRVWANSQEKVVFCDQGYSCLGSFLEGRTPYAYNVEFTDQQSGRVVREKLSVYSQKRDHERAFQNLLINRLLNNPTKGTQILLANDHFKQQQLSACLSDTHHGLYHYYLDPEEEYDYAEAFLPEGCFFLLSGDQPSLRVPVEVKPGSYKVLVRFLKHNRGGSFRLSSAAFGWDFTSLRREGQNGYAYEVRDLTTDQTINAIGFYGQEGINFINLVAFIPEKRYQQELERLNDGVVFLGESKEPSPEDTEEVSVTQVKKVSPTEWEAQITAKRPFVLNFAERFHPEWEVEIYQDDQLIRVARSKSAYAQINSFDIEETGEMTVKVKYGLQEEFYRKFFLSWVVLGIIMIFSLFQPERQVSIS